MHILLIYKRWWNLFIFKIRIIKRRFIIFIWIFINRSYYQFKFILYKLISIIFSRVSFIWFLFCWLSFYRFSFIFIITSKHRTRLKLTTTFIFITATCIIWRWYIFYLLNIFNIFFIIHMILSSCFHIFEIKMLIY